jgi:hypothetical protein
MREGRGVTFAEGRVYGLRKRMAVAHSEGGGVKVDGALWGRWGRGRRWWRDNDQERCTNNLRKRTAAECFEAGVEAAACSRAGDETMVFCGAGIEDARWRHDGF